MSKFATLLVLLGIAGGAANVAVAFAPVGERSLTVFAQEDCVDGEKWNEETQKCEKEGE